MNKSALLACAVLGVFSLKMTAQQPAWEPAPGHLTMPLWPGVAPGAPANLPPEVDTTKPDQPLIAGRRIIRLGNVSKPTLTIYSPKGNNTGAAVVVFPGGGYQILAIDSRELRYATGSTGSA